MNMGLLTVIKNMARNKRVDVEPEGGALETISISDTSESNYIPIEKLAIDYTNEGLNNIARKINEIIERLN